MFAPVLRAAFKATGGKVYFHGLDTARDKTDEQA
jgi:hypothetical protein